MDKLLEDLEKLDNKLKALGYDNSTRAEVLKTFVSVRAKEITK